MSQLTDCTNIVLRDEVPNFNITVCHGVSISALIKKDCGVGPIAVGNTMWRLVTKTGIKPLSVRLGYELRPEHQGL